MGGPGAKQPSGGGLPNVNAARGAAACHHAAVVACSNAPQRLRRKTALQQHVLPHRHIERLKGWLETVAACSAEGLLVCCVKRKYTSCMHV